MEQKYIANWTSFSVHMAGVFVMMFLSYYKIQKMQRRFIILSGAAFMISALYEMALARGQGIFLRDDFVITQWGRWAGSLPSELIIAYLAAYLVYLKKNARWTFLYCVTAMITSLLIITISTDNIWIWFGVAVGHFLFASKILIVDSFQKFHIIRFGFPLVYALYGLFFLLGPTVNQNLSQAGENFAYMALDLVTKVVFWIVVVLYVDIREGKTERIGTYAQPYMHYTKQERYQQESFEL